MINLNDYAQKALERKKEMGWKLDHDYNFVLLHGEVTEAYNAAVKAEGKDRVGEELADVIIYAIGIAAIEGINIEEAIENKWAKNIKRTYTRLDNGTPVRIKTQEDK